ncbi:MAG: hypothetical protein M3083_02435 [Actinomycetota bacterium]|nr:hypothetical protein [Actinomycetota bacterium]MDQ6945487.1 hypothetical protein [Actinomycetota bacterium]
MRATGPLDRPRFRGVWRTRRNRARSDFLLDLQGRIAERVRPRVEEQHLERMKAIFNRGPDEVCLLAGRSVDPIRDWPVRVHPDRPEEMVILGAESLPEHDEVVLAAAKVVKAWLR